VGIITYLYFASWIWAPVGEEGLLGGPGDPIIWGSTAFPIFAVCSLMNFVWFFVALRKLRRYRIWQHLIIWLTVVAVWVGVDRYDTSRQYTGADFQIEAPARQK
jgi:hypothetical protein